MLQRLEEHQKSPFPLNRDSRFEQLNQMSGAMKVSKANSGNAFTTAERHSRAHTPTTGFFVTSMCLEKPLITVIGDGKTQETLDWTMQHLITLTFKLRSECLTRSLKFKVLVSHSSGSVAALEGPKELFEHVV